jgi:hypothetical protein
VHEAGWVSTCLAGSTLGEVAGGYRPAGDLEPPPLPLPGRLGWLPGDLAPFSPVAGQGRVIG